MKILLLGTLPETPEQMKWIENQPADLIVFARDPCNGGEVKSSRSWVLRLPVAAGNLECFNGKSPEWIYELRHVRLAGSRSDMTKSTPVVFLPWPSPSREDDWFAAAKQKYVDISDSKEPWFLLTHSASKDADCSDSTEILTLNLSDIARPRITICGITRAPKSESRRLWLDVEACDGPVPHHVWIG
ncbi:MAG: hypothetical protein ACOYM3_16450 [Terrimicrobiaceae bacterium]